MADDVNTSIKTRIDRIRLLTGKSQGSKEFYEAAILAQSVIYDTVGGSHPIMAALDNAVQSGDWMRVVAASNAVVVLYDQGGIKSPRMTIAREIEGDILDIAQAQAQAAESCTDPSHKRVHLGISAFLAEASLEDALRRLCDARSLAYDAHRTSISRLQAALYQPTKQIEVISQSENKRITAWGDTRNKADHGRFDEITQTEVLAMILGARALIEKHLS